jgi:hypothetical protein
MAGDLVSAWSCRFLRRVLPLAALALCLPALARAQGAPAPAPAATLTPEQQKRMETWVKSMTPGAPHKWLASRVGKFDFAGKFWMEPGAPPQAAKGVAERTLLLGGRVLQEKVTSSLMGMPLDGLGLAGFDNVSGQFWSTWNDSLSTGVRVAGGKCDEAMKSCVWKGTYSNPDTGRSQAVRLELKLDGADREVLTAYEAGADGKEARSMELVYTRRKP